MGEYAGGTYHGLVSGSSGGESGLMGRIIALQGYGGGHGHLSAVHSKCSPAPALQAASHTSSVHVKEYERNTRNICYITLNSKLYARYTGSLRTNLSSLFVVLVLRGRGSINQDGYTSWWEPRLQVNGEKAKAEEGTATTDQPLHHCVHHRNCVPPY